MIVSSVLMDIFMIEKIKFAKKIQFLRFCFAKNIKYLFLIKIKFTLVFYVNKIIVFQMNNIL